MASDRSLRWLGWGACLGAAAIMCMCAVSVGPSPDRCTFPDAAYVQADRIIRVSAVAGVSVAGLAAAARSARRRAPGAEPGAATDGGA